MPATRSDEPTDEQIVESEAALRAAGIGPSPTRATAVRRARLGAAAVIAAHQGAVAAPAPSEHVRACLEILLRPAPSRTDAA